MYNINTKIKDYKFETYFGNNSYTIVVLVDNTVYYKEEYKTHCFYDKYENPRFYISINDVSNQIIKKALNLYGAISGKRIYIYRGSYALEKRINVRGKIIHHCTYRSYYTNSTESMLLFDSQREHQEYHIKNNIPYDDFISTETDIYLVYNPPQKPKERKKRISKTIVDKIKKYKNLGYSYRKIQHLLKVSSKTISQVLNTDKYNVLPPLRKALKNIKPAITGKLSIIKQKIGIIKNRLKSFYSLFDIHTYYLTGNTKQHKQPLAIAIPYTNTC